MNVCESHRRDQFKSTTTIQESAAANGKCEYALNAIFSAFSSSMDVDGFNVDYFWSRGLRSVRKVVH
jgi:hypothetical protein